jgi:hypothetical protein
LYPNLLEVIGVLDTRCPIIASLRPSSSAFSAIPHLAENRPISSYCPKLLPLDRVAIDRNWPRDLTVNVQEPKEKEHGTEIPCSCVLYYTGGGPKRQRADEH